MGQSCFATQTPDSSGFDQQDLSPFDIDNDNRIEHPQQHYPGSLNKNGLDPGFEYTKAHCIKHTITHEMGHGMGIDQNGFDSTCVMNVTSQNWNRDGCYGTAKPMIYIHNNN